MNLTLIIIFSALGLITLAGIITFIKGLRKIERDLKEWSEKFNNGR